MFVQNKFLRYVTTSFLQKPNIGYSGMLKSTNWTY